MTLSACKIWWPGTELNRRRQPFQGCSHPKLSGYSARHSFDFLPDFVLLIGAKMEPSKVVQICLPRFASNRQRLRPAARTKETKKDGWAGDRGFNLLSFTRLKIFQIHWKIGSLTPNPAEA